MTDLERFAGNLRRLRIERHLTQAELADACGIGQSHISEYESGEFGPEWATLTKLADALGCSVGKLAEGEKP